MVYYVMKVYRIEASCKCKIIYFKIYNKVLMELLVMVIIKLINILIYNWNYKIKNNFRNDK